MPKTLYKAYNSLLRHKGNVVATSACGVRMHKVQTALPRRELKEFVRVFAAREVCCAAGSFCQSDIASLEHIISFDFADLSTLHYNNGRSKRVPLIHFVGSQTAASSYAHFTGHHVGFGIFLRPFASWQLFHIPPAVFANENGHGVDLLGNHIQSLWQRLAEKDTFHERIQVAEDYLLPYAVNAVARTVIMDTAQHIYRRHGEMRISDLAGSTALSTRQYERRFVTDIGFGPKLFARMTRFQVALDAKRRAPDQSWATIAQRFGYFDQMHMVRDFRSLGARSPSEIFGQIGDFQPWSLSTPETPYYFPEEKPIERRR